MSENPIQNRICLSLSIIIISSAREMEKIIEIEKLINTQEERKDQIEAKYVKK